MRILVIGSGGREHALAWSIKHNHPGVELYVSPGNAGTSLIGTNLNIDPLDFEGIAKAVEEFSINGIVIGPEAPLVAGLRNFIKDRFGDKIWFVGPGKEGSKLEGSKVWAKRFMKEMGIPTAEFYVADEGNLNEVVEQVAREWDPPYVLKADGLAAGKGVVIVDNKDDLVATATDMVINRRFGEASSSIVIERFLPGIEASVFLWVDGDSYVLLPTAKDYKKAFDGDKGPNTGGMGSVSPGWLTGYHIAKVKSRIIEPTIDGLLHKNIHYTGFLYIGLMFVNDDPYVLEYNVRLGDPETQAIMPRLEVDWLGLWIDNNFSMREKPDYAVTVILASEGYPGKYEKGFVITGLEKLEGEKDIFVFHAGTKLNEEGEVVTNGGRVLAITALGPRLSIARNRAYEAVEKINFENKFYRTDIGVDLMEKVNA